MHWLEIIIELPPGVSPESAYGVIYANGSTGCSEEGGVIHAYFAPDTDTGEVVREIESTGAKVVSVGRVEDSDWSAGWKETIGPYRTQGFLICPPWKLEECTPLPGELKLVIDPGEAFGEGGHPTTSCVLGLMREWADDLGELSSLALLDVGTGTGILSVAGCALGFGRVKAVDIEQKAVNTARSNFEHNGVEDGVELSQDGIDGVSGAFDLVVANVFLEPLMDIIPKAATMLIPGGAMIVSGVLADQFADIMECAGGAGLSLSQRVDAEGWVSALFVSAALREARP